MFDRTPSRIWLLTLVCVALLCARLGGGHLHLCFDGSEPPVSLHLMYNGQHHMAGTDAGHQDADVALADEALAKSIQLVLDLPAALVVALLIWSLRQTRRPPAPGFCLPLFFSATRLRPPLRGPPLLISL